MDLDSAPFSWGLGAVLFLLREFGSLLGYYRVALTRSNRISEGFAFKEEIIILIERRVLLDDNGVEFFSGISGPLVP